MALPGDGVIPAGRLLLEWELTLLEPDARNVHCQRRSNSVPILVGNSLAKVEIKT